MAGPQPISPAEVADRMAILDLLHRYCRAIDTKDWDLLDQVFTPEAWIDYTSSGGTKGRFAEVKEWLAVTLVRFAMTQHLVTNVEITLDGDRAASRAYFYNPMGTARAEGGLDLFFVGGYYVDRLERTPLGWRIAERLEQQAWVQGR